VICMLGCVSCTCKPWLYNLSSHFLISILPLLLQDAVAFLSD
jgi:hypothetical protein